MTVEMYLYRRDKLLNTPFKIDTNGIGHYIEGDKQYTREEYHKKYDTPICLVTHNKPNYDGTRNYLFVE